MGKIKKAIILAAGLGTRLKSVGYEIPKCLLRFGGETILEKLLKELDSIGIQKVVLITGHKEYKIKQTIGNEFGKIKIQYVFNKIYDKTNNIYSLWLVRDQLNEDLLLFESDLLIRPGIIKNFVDIESEDVMMLEKFRQGLDGTVVSLNDN